MENKIVFDIKFNVIFVKRLPIKNFHKKKETIVLGFLFNLKTKLQKKILKIFIAKKKVKQQ